MRRDSVVAGQIIAASSLHIRGGPGLQGELQLELEPADDGDDVILRFDSQAAHLLDRDLPARIRTTIRRQYSNQLLRALRQMCVADRLKPLGRQGLEVSWQFQLAGGLWEVSFCETEEHPPLVRALEAVDALAGTASKTPGANVLQAPPPPPKSRRGWLALVALLAAVALTALAVVVLSS